MPLSAAVASQPGPACLPDDPGCRPLPEADGGARRLPWLALLAAASGTAALLVAAGLRLAGSVRELGGVSATPPAHLLLALAAVATAWEVSRRRVLHPSRRGAWELLALSFGCEALRVVLLPGVHAAGSVAPTAPAPLLALAAGVLSAGLALAAVLRLVRTGPDGADGATLPLDTAIAAVALAALGWQVELQTLVAPHRGAAWPVWLAVADVVLGLAVLLGIAVLLLRRTGAGAALPLRILGLAALLSVGIDVVHARLLLRGGAIDADALLLAHAVAAWLTVLAAVAQLRHAGAERPAPPVGYAAPVPGLIQLAVAALLGALLLEARHVERYGRPLLARHAPAAPLMPLAFGISGLALLLVARQRAAQRHARQLVADAVASAAYHRALVQHASDAILVLDAAGRVRDAGPGVAHVLGRTPAALVGRPLVELVDEADRARAAAELAEVIEAGAADGRRSAHAPHEWRVRHGDGGLRWCEVVCTNLLHEDAVGGVVVSARDVSERKTLEAELTHQAFHDSLTGLLNRARFTAAVDAALARLPAFLDERSHLAVLYVDLDEFKPVNDRHGHAVGDQVLASVAERLRDATRGSDTVARLGGDEFGVLLERVRNHDEARMVAERVVRLLGEPLVVGGGTVRVGASVGVVFVERGGAEQAAEALLREADRAMYDAKACGGRQYRLRGAGPVGAAAPAGSAADRG